MIIRAYMACRIMDSRKRETGQVNRNSRDCCHTPENQDSMPAT